MNKGKRSSHYITPQKHGKLAKPLGNSSSTKGRERRENNSDLSIVEVQYANQAKLPLRDGNKQKEDIQKDTKSLHCPSYDQPNKLVSSVHKMELDLKVTHLPSFKSPIQYPKLFIHIYICIFIHREDYPIFYHGIQHGDGVLWNGFIVQLITHGLLKGSLLST